MTEHALVDALLEMTHAQGDDVTPAPDGEGVTLTRQTPFLRVTPAADGGAEVFFCYRGVAPADDRLRDLDRPTADGATHRLHLDACAMDADLIALEPLIEAAYAQNG